MKKFLLLAILVAITGTAHAAQSDYDRGLRDRAAWESWFSSTYGEAHIGAEWWATHRSEPKPDCDHLAATASRGCAAAKQKLDPFDAQRKVNPDYRNGWNAWTPSAPIPTAPSTAAAPVTNAAPPAAAEKLVYSSSDIPDIVEASRYNPARFVLNYKGRSFADSVVFERQRATFTEVGFLFSDKSRRQGGQCDFVRDRDSLLQLADLKKGDEVLVWGFIDDTSFGDLLLSGCRLIRANG